MKRINFDKLFLQFCSFILWLAMFLSFYLQNEDLKKEVKKSRKETEFWREKFEEEQKESLQYLMGQRDILKECNGEDAT